MWAASWQNQQSDYAPSKDSDQPGHPPSLIRVFAVHMKKARVLSYPLSAQWRLWSDWADAQVDLSLCWAHSHFAGFVMKQLNCTLCKYLNTVSCYSFITCTECMLVFVQISWGLCIKFTRKKQQKHPALLFLIKEGHYKGQGSNSWLEYVIRIFRQQKWQEGLGLCLKDRVYTYYGQVSY